MVVKLYETKMKEAGSEMKQYKSLDVVTKERFEWGLESLVEAERTDISGKDKRIKKLFTCLRISHRADIIIINRSFRWTACEKAFEFTKHLITMFKYTVSLSLHFSHLGIEHSTSKNIKRTPPTLSVFVPELLPSVFLLCGAESICVDYTALSVNCCSTPPLS